MIFIVVKFETRPDWTRRWPGLVERFTVATWAEPGNLWFDSARRLETRPCTSWHPLSATPKRVRRTPTASTSKGAAGDAASARVHAEDSQPNDRCDRPVGDGGVDDQLPGTTAISSPSW
jgi:hypothetical protein